MINDQIVALYEKSGLTPEEIHQALPQYSIESIKLTLVQCSGDYRKEARKNKELFDENVEEYAKSRAAQLLDEDDPNIVLKAAKLIINHNKELRNPIKAIKDSGQININIWNNQFAKVNDALAHAKSTKPPKPPIDTEILLEA